MTEVDVVIIGGGVSGLSAAKLLHEQGLNIVVLEARDRVGGRTYTIKDPGFQYTDLGGAYISPTHRRVARFANKFGLELHELSVEKRTVVRFEDKWHAFSGYMPPIYNPITLLDVNHLQRTVTKLSEQVPAATPWKAPKAEVWDSMTLKEFMDKNCWTDFTYEMFRIISRCMLCAEPHEVSFLSFLWDMASGEGGPPMMNSADGEQDSKFVGGSMQLSERLADCVKGKVWLNCEVIQVEQEDSEVKVRTSDGKEIKAQYVISAIPLTLLNRVRFIPPLPPLKLQMIQRLPMGSVIKTMTFYKKRFWQDLNLSGQMITDSGPVVFCIDDTKPDGTAPCLMGFIVADKARELSSLKPEQRKAHVAKHYAEVFRIPELLHPIDYREKNWMEDEFSGGGYSSNFPPGTLTLFGEEMRRPFLRTYFAGTETAVYWSGYIEGAIGAGERAAREVLHAMGKISSSEIWKEEPPDPWYPETSIAMSYIERMLPSVPGFLAFTLASAVALGAWFLHRWKYF